MGQGLFGLALVGGTLGTLAPTEAVGAPAAARYYLRLQAVELADGVADVTVTGAGDAAAPTSAPAAAATPAAAPPAATPAAAVEVGAKGKAGGDGLAVMARTKLVEALRKRPEVVLEQDAFPDGTTPELDKVTAELKRRNLKGYEVTLRILKQQRSVLPPAPGAKFRRLEQTIKLTLVGDTLPGKQLALGGDGESTVQYEVGAQISESQQREALADALNEAVQQAVDQSLKKLMAGAMKPPKDLPKKKK